MGITPSHRPTYRQTSATIINLGGSPEVNHMEIKFKADNFAVAEVTTLSEQHVSLKLDATDKWDAAGLLKLSALLKGVAAALVASMVILGLMTVADATDWIPYNMHGADAAERQSFR